VGIPAVRRDPVVQQTLLGGLWGAGPLPVDRMRTIQLLAEDNHPDTLQWLAELYRSDSEDARQDAGRLLANRCSCTALG